VLHGGSAAIATGPDGLGTAVEVRIRR